MKIGLQIPSFTWPGGPEQLGSHLARIGQAADEAGFASLWVMDHFFQIAMIGKPDEPMLEGYSALSFLAAVTRRVRLGTLVTGVIYRHPGILVKTVTALDVLSGGRAYFGIGAAWFEREAVGLGVPFPPMKERFERLEEALQIAHQMWSGKVAAYNGKHYRLAEPLNSPQAVSKPRPPIMVGGVGEKKTLYLVARYADACNLFAFAGPEAIRAKLAVLRRHCEQVGRPYEEIERTAVGTLDVGQGAMSAREAIEYCRRMSDAGVQHLIVSLSRVHEIKPIEVMGKEVIPRVVEF
ncbi:MAG: LLM class F420-dependent oxidoreductase [Deltaproteobacteria bacterium]|nr:LLM class F420-dependent oxidoreductase [Deltaproteobacteria bacterium]